eukprot:GCRY01003895.1.p1 GENE.GCRY01003895.1~~GCRY01003895.1.p1  ORF type:complete len:447 (+),score=133.87 GCRY01003895.1:195-1535(+)
MFNGGDEVGALVLDIGSYLTKAGYSGEDAPRVVLPSNVGHRVETCSTQDENQMEVEGENVQKQKDIWYLDTPSIASRSKDVEIRNPFNDSGLLENSDCLESILNYTFGSRLRLDPSEHPVLLADPARSHSGGASSAHLQEHRKQMAELFFERFNVPGYFTCKDAVLTSFASGRSTALVLDVGSSAVTAVPVHEGYVLTKAITSSPIGGSMLDTIFQEYLAGSGVVVRGSHEFKKKPTAKRRVYAAQPQDQTGVRDSYTAFMRGCVAADIKESLCRIIENTQEERGNVPYLTYELPDGQSVEVGGERYAIPELLFNPQATDPSLKGLDEIVAKHNIASEGVGVASLVTAAVNKCDVDHRKDLYNSLILSGGSSLFHGFVERLHSDLYDTLPPSYRLRVLASTSAVERKFSAWIGGSILSSLGTFQHMWVTKAEYEEVGPNLLSKRCP